MIALMPQNFEKWHIDVKVELAKRQMEVTELAAQLNLSRPYVSSVISGRFNIAEIRKQISELLDVEYIG